VPRLTLEDGLREMFCAAGAEGSDQEPKLSGSRSVIKG
jgi:hypothetical protein